MRRMMLLLIAIVVTIGSILSCFQPGQAQDLTHRVGDYRYPAAKIESGGWGGANSASGSHVFASMVTTDPLDDVIAYYEKKLNVDLSKKGGYGKSMGNMNNIFENNYQGRPLSLRIFQQHTKVYSLLLVVSRGNEEKDTHIYWSMTYH